MTCIDSYSKFLYIKNIEDKTKLDEKVLEILQAFPEAKHITVDNEPGFSTPQFKTLMQRLGIIIYYCDPHHSSTNGQVERVHSTLIEIARCLKQEFSLISDLESIFRAAHQYNKTIHSVTNEKPYEILYNKKTHENIPNRLSEAQGKMLQTHNKKRNTKEYRPNQTAYEKIAGCRNKLLPRYKKQKVKEDLGRNIVIHKNNRIIHKDNIKT